MRITIITGMHRSGTSVLARVADLLGADFGPEAEFLDRAPDNPDGFWENRRVVELNSAVLRSLGGRWDEPPTLESDWALDPRLDELRREALAIITEVFATAPAPAWKDPRASLLLPFWTSILDHTQTVIALRHPAEVAASLRKRNGFAPERSEALWLRYVTDAVLDAPRPPLLVWYDDLLEKPREVCFSLADHLGLAEPDEDGMVAVERVVDPRRRHHDERGSGVAAARLNSAQSAYDLLRAEPLASCVPMLEAYRDGLRSHSRLVEVQRLGELVAESEQQLADLSQANATLRDAHEAAERRLTESEKAQDALAAQLAALTAEAEAARRELLARAQQAEAGAAKLAAQVAARDRAIEQRARRVDKVRAARDESERRLAETERTLARLQQRRVVRAALALAAPFKPVFRVVRWFRRG